MNTQQAIEAVLAMDGFDKLRHYSHYLIDVACSRMDALWYHERDGAGFYDLGPLQAVTPMFPHNGLGGGFARARRHQHGTPDIVIHNSAGFRLWKDMPRASFFSFCAIDIHDNGPDWKERGWAAEHTYHFDGYSTLVGRLVNGTAHV